jgi:hypothetical protein
MSPELPNTSITVIRRVRLRTELKPVSGLVAPDNREVEWLCICHVTDRTGFVAFDFVFLTPFGAGIPGEGFETLRIAKDQARAEIGVQYVEWELCDVQVLDKNGTLHYERALPVPRQTTCSHRG